MIEIKKVQTIGKDRQRSALNRKKRNKYSALDKYLIFCFSVLMIYTICHSIIFYLTGQEASTLSVLVFGVFGTSEPIICGLIKLFKLKNDIKKKDPEDQDQEGGQG